MKYYNKDNFEKLKKERCLAKLCLVFLSLIVVGLCVLLSFLINENNQILIGIANTSLTTALLWIMIYVFDNEIFVRTRKIKHFEMIYKSTKKEFEGQVLKIGNAITLNGGILGREVLVLIDDQKLCLYLLSDFDFVFSENDNVKLIVTKEFITDVEVVK